jgi:hypothetical protein
MNNVNQLTVIEKHPIPTSEDRAESLQQSNPTFEDRDRILHPDELHEQYKEVLAENCEWRVFRSYIYGHSGDVFFWNHQLGYGIRFHDEEGSAQNFFQVMAEATESES